MKQINFVFQVHQPYRLRDFSFFEIGTGENYFDDQKNAEIVQRVSIESYLPANQLLLQTIKTYGKKIKVTLAVSGSVLDQMEQYAPYALDSFKELAATGNVEFLGQTSSASLSCLKSETEFLEDIAQHSRRIRALFGQKPGIFMNTGLIHSEKIGHILKRAGFRGAITEGLSPFLKGQSPNFVYQSLSGSSFKLLLRNTSLSEDISLRFSKPDWNNYPLTAEKYFKWLRSCEGPIVNLVMDYATLGEHLSKETGIFDFFQRLLVLIAEDKCIRLSTPTEILIATPAKARVNIVDPISWAGPNKDLSAWLQNEMQKEALDTLYNLEGAVKAKNVKQATKIWRYLQAADHFYYMNNQDEFQPIAFSNYSNPYEAFTNYMNVLSDFSLQLESRDKISSDTSLIVR